MRLLPGKRSSLPGQEAAPTSQLNRLRTQPRKLNLNQNTNSTLGNNFGRRLKTTRIYERKKLANSFLVLIDSLILRRVSV